MALLHTFTADFITDSGHVRRILFAPDLTDAYRSATQMAAQRKEHFCFASIRQVEGDYEPVIHAQWVAQDSTFTKFACSHCLSGNHASHHKRCPECGAYMAHPWGEISFKREIANRWP